MADVIELIIEEELLDVIPGKVLTYMNADTFELVSSDAELEEPFVEMDENIAYVISTLNKLGYKTEWSCEGHYGHGPNKEESESLVGNAGGIYIGFEEGYISFAENIALPFIPENWEYVFIDGRIALYAKPKGHAISESEFLLWKFTTLINLVEWVDALPKYGDSAL